MEPAAGTRRHPPVRLEAAGADARGTTKADPASAERAAARTARAATRNTEKRRGKPRRGAEWRVLSRRTFHAVQQHHRGERRCGRQQRAPALPSAPAPRGSGRAGRSSTDSRSYLVDRRGGAFLIRFSRLRREKEAGATRPTSVAGSTSPSPMAMPPATTRHGGINSAIREHCQTLLLAFGQARLQWHLRARAATTPKSPLAALVPIKSAQPGAAPCRSAGADRDSVAKMRRATLAESGSDGRAGRSRREAGRHRGRRR